MLQGGDGEQDADEEDDGPHVDPHQRVGQGQLLLLLGRFLTMDDLPGQPQDAQAEQYTHEGRQVCHGLEDRNGNEGAETHEENQVPFEGVSSGTEGRFRLPGRDDLPPPEQ